MAKKSNNINTDIFCALKVAEKSGVPVLFISNPGVGKTTSVYYFAKVRGYEVVLLRGNSTTAEEVMGYDVAPKDVTYDHKMAAINLRPSWFEEVIRNHEAGKKTLLFLDEITTANEFVQSALLHLIFERKVHTESLPEDTLIVSAGNYAQNLSNTMGLLPPVMNRFMIFNVIPDSSDLETFLNKYEGSLISSDGTRKDYFVELEKMMRDLDSQELKLTEGKINKIGEYIEKGIRECARELMTQGEKPVDMRVTDLQNIYADNSDGDPKLYGFVSFRTLNYLRDVTLAYYLCFGKPGISSVNYRNSIDGLCGCGVSRDGKHNGDVKLDKTIGKSFFDTMNTIVNDIEKMNNNKLPEYEKFFRNYIGKDSIPDPELNGLGNKLDELMKDKELSNIERPIDTTLIEEICKSLSNSANSIAITKAKLKNTEDSVADLFPAEQMVKYVVTWNLIADIAGTLQSLITDSKRGYSNDIKAHLVNVFTSLTPVTYKLAAIRKRLVTDDSSIGSIIPEVKMITVKK